MCLPDLPHESLIVLSVLYDIDMIGYVLATYCYAANYHKIRSLNQHKFFFLSVSACQESRYRLAESFLLKVSQSKIKTLTVAAASPETQNSRLSSLFFWQFYFHDIAWLRSPFLASSWRQTALRVIFSQHLCLLFQGPQKSAWCFLLSPLIRSGPPRIISFDSLKVN